MDGRAHARRDLLLSVGRQVLESKGAACIRCNPSPRLLMPPPPLALSRSPRWPIYIGKQSSHVLLFPVICSSDAATFLYEETSERDKDIQTDN